VEVTTLDGKQKLTIAKGSQYGTLLRVNEAGLPSLRTGRRGDLIVVIKIETPTKLSAQQEKLLREFAATENHDVMPESQGFWKKMKDALRKEG
jgi:molecular chaperone DnaJ